MFMLRSNLSTRPFYNERGVHWGLAVAALVVAAVTVFNARDLVTLSARNTALAAGIARDETAARDLAREADTIRQSLDRAELEAVTQAAREANDLIDQRIFSWTAFFNVIETTLPPDVMLTSVRPRIQQGVVTITINVVGRQTEDLDLFMSALEETGAFADLLPRQEEIGDDGMHRAVLTGRYLGPPKTTVEGGAQPRAGS